MWVAIDGLYTIGELYTSDQFRQLVGPSRRRLAFSASCASLKAMAKALLFDRQPFDRIVLYRTVANVLSMRMLSKTCPTFTFQTSSRSFGRGRDVGFPTPPRSDPYERDYRIRFLPRVMTPSAGWDRDEV